MVFVIIFLYALITISFAANWSCVRSAFIENGTNFWTVTSMLSGTGQAVSLEAGITASISTILADLYMVCATLPGIIHTSSPSFQPLDLVLLDGLGTTLVRCYSSNTFPNFCNW